MWIFKQVADLQLKISQWKAEGKTVGFVPTMGALHAGHVSLLQAAKTDIRVCSIFVNPTQFNDATDLEKYPRTPEADISLLLDSQSCDLLFMPPVEEVYPPNFIPKHFDFGPLAKVMEGAFRPGHFDGMAQVVNRLLDIVQPHELYMGQKDFQQVSIVAEVLFLLDSPIKLVVVPTLREADGLAMSSRNVRLNAEERAKAPIIYGQLTEAKKAMLLGEPIPSAMDKIKTALLAAGGFEPEYMTVVDGKTLQPLSQLHDSDYAVLCLATWLGKVRLIDNVVVKR